MGVSLQWGDDHLDALLDALKKEGVEIDPKRKDFDHGRLDCGSRGEQD